MPEPYDPVGHCIYCGTEIYSQDEPTRKLGEEHIIPRQVRGRLILKEASCREHEAATSGVETRVTPLYDPGKAHLGIKGRKSRKVRSRIPITLGGGQKMKIGLDEHPGMVAGYVFKYPGILLGLNPGGTITGGPQFSFINEDYKKRVEALPRGFQYKLGAGVDAEDFARMLAKIAHSYSIAEGRIHWTKSMLTGAILGNAMGDLPWLVGSSSEPSPRSETHEHEIGFVNADPNFLTVRIRLFASHGLAAHYVVVSSSQ